MILMRPSHTLKILISLAVFINLLLAFSLYADMGKPSVQALCRITLNSGGAVEGFIFLGRGGYQRYIDTNGFLIIHDTEKVKGINQIIFFNLNLNAVEPYNLRIYDLNGVSAVNGLRDSIKIYYLQDVTIAKNYKGDIENVKIDKHSVPPTMTKTITHESVYELLDYVPIHRKLPDIIHLENSEQLEIKPEKIPVKNIKRFELLKEPSKKWLDMISSKESTWNDKYGNCDDCVLMVEWYHVLARLDENDAYRDYINSSFKTIWY
ncbi:secreted protein [Candidatus Magnetoovum chiemensis]|nr:secreted protein [Candidatus Magnetoovum chiemensis]